MANHKYNTIRLDNGVRVVHATTPEFGSVYIQLTLRAGPSTEEKFNNGISHFAEHLILEGTEDFPDNDAFDEQIEYLGGSYNGYTNQNRICFYIKLPDDQVELGMHYISQLCTSVLFKEENYAREKKAILDEIHNDNNEPYTKYNNFWKKRRFEQEQLTILGTKKTISGMKLEEIRAWYKNIMFPENMLLTVVGNVKKEKVERLVNKFFAQIPATGQDVNKTLPFIEPDISQKRVDFMIDEDEKQTLHSISFRSLSMLPHDYKSTQMAWIIANSLARYRNSILFKILRKDKGWLYSISSSHYFGYYKDGVYEISFETGENNLPEIYSIIIDNILQLKNSGLEEKVVNHAIQRGNNALKMGHQSIGDIVSWITGAMFWDNSIFTIEESIEQRNSITTEEVNALIPKIFDFEYINVLSRVKKKSTSKELRSLLKKNYSL